MKHQGNKLALLFILIFVFFTAFLHKKEGPLNPLNLHEAAYLKRHHSPIVTLTPTFKREQHSLKFEKKKLRVRYKGSDVSFHIAKPFRFSTRAEYVAQNFSLHITPMEPSHLRHVAALRAPPAGVFDPA